jgi:cell division septation protein DedD
MALICSPAGAQQSQRFELSWSAPAACPAREAVVREIDELLAGSSAVTPATTSAANAVVLGDGADFSLTLSVRDSDGWHERKLDAPTCEELGHATALIVALGINPALLVTHADPGGVSQNPSFAPSQATAVSSPTATNDPRLVLAPRAAAKAETPSIAATSEAPKKSLQLRLGLIEFVSFRTLPGTNLGTGVFAAIQGQAARLEAMASGVLAEARASKPGAGATFALYRLAAKGCWLITKNRWALGPCAGMELGRLRGSGYGVDVTKEPRGIWLASTLGTLLDLRITSSSTFGITADLELPWLPHQFELAGSGLFESRTAARAGVSLSAGW